MATKITGDEAVKIGEFGYRNCIKGRMMWKVAGKICQRAPNTIKHYARMYEEFGAEKLKRRVDAMNSLNFTRSYLDDYLLYSGCPLHIPLVDNLPTNVFDKPFTRNYQGIARN